MVPCAYGILVEAFAAGAAMPKHLRNAAARHALLPQVCLAAESCGHLSFDARVDKWWSSEIFHCGAGPRRTDVHFHDIFLKARPGKAVGTCAGGLGGRRDATTVDITVCRLMFLLATANGVQVLPAMLRGARGHGGRRHAA